MPRTRGNGSVIGQVITPGGSGVVAAQDATQYVLSGQWPGTTYAPISGASVTISSIVVTDSGYNNLDDTAAATSNSYIRILGSGFSSTANVFLNGTMVPKANITFVSSSELRAQLPVSNTGNYAISVFNSNTAGALYSSSFVISTMPQWLTGATLANTASGTPFSTTLSATSDSNITYANTTSLPAGTTLAANGLFSGTITTGVQTTYSFDVKATDDENQDSSRTFSVTVTVTPATKLYTWGSNTNGRLGLNDTISRSSPVQVGTGTDWNQVSSSDYAFAGIKTDGTLWTWGYNLYGGLGHNNTTDRSSPVQVGTSTNWSSVNVSGGDRVSMHAIKTDGTLWAWGNSDSQGTLGLDNRNNVSSPTQVGTNTTWSKINGTDFNVGALKTNGTLWVWGKGSFGNLGLNDTNIPRSSPTQLGSQTNWIDISVGTNFSFARKNDLTLWAIGGYTGQLGVSGLNNTISFQSSPIQVGTNTNWSNVKVTQGHAIALKTDGTLWTWGINDSGQLGLNNVARQSSPTQVGTGTDWSKIGNGNEFMSAIKTNGTLWIWGVNTIGQLGLNDRVNRSSPVQIGTGTNWNKLGDYANYTPTAITLN